MKCVRCSKEFEPKVGGRPKFCPDCRPIHKLEHAREKYWQNVEHNRARAKAYYWANRDAIREYQRKYREC